MKDHPLRRVPRVPATAVGAAFAVLWILAAPTLLEAQEPAAEAREPEAVRPAADPSDVESIEAIIDAGYDAISGAAGEPRNWERFRSLLLPEARLVITGRQEGEPFYRVLTVEEFIAVAKKTFVREGMYEEPIHRVTERFGDMAHVFVTDVSRRTPEAEPFERGINSFQLWHDGERWWVVSILLHTEREGAPIPERYVG